SLGAVLCAGAGEDRQFIPPPTAIFSTATRSCLCVPENFREFDRAHCWMPDLGRATPSLRHAPRDAFSFRLTLHVTIFAPQPTNGAKNLPFIHSIGAGTDHPQAKNWCGATS